MDARSDGHIASQLGLVLDAITEAVALRVAALLSKLPPPGHEPPAAQKLLDVQQAAAHLALSSSTIYKLAGAGQLTRVKLGSRLRFRVEDLDAYAEAHRRGTGQVIDMARHLRSRGADGHAGR